MTNLELALRNAEERLPAKVEAPNPVTRLGLRLIAAVKVSARRAC